MPAALYLHLTLLQFPGSSSVSKGHAIVILIVMYELQSERDFGPLREAIESHGPSCHFFDSFCLVSTDRAPAHVRTALLLAVEGQAVIYVSQLSHEHTTYMPKDARDWLATHRPHDTKR